MAALHIVREHGLGLAKARKIAARWADEVQRELGLSCRAEAEPGAERIHFERSGVSGFLRVTAERFELEAELGWLLGAFKGRIETEVLRHLDEQLAAQGGGPGKGKGKG